MGNTTIIKSELTPLNPHEQSVLNIYIKNVRPLFQLNPYTKDYFNKIFINNYELFKNFEPILNLTIYDITTKDILILWVLHHKIYNKIKLNIIPNVNSKQYQHSHTIPYEYLKINEIHAKSKGENIKIGIIDDGYCQSANIQSFSFVDDNSNDGNSHGKATCNIFLKLNPESKILAIKTYQDNRNQSILIILLGIIACIIEKCNIINISRNTKMSILDLPYINNLLIKYNHLINIPIITSSGNEEKRISSRAFAKYPNVITVGGYNINDNKRYGNYGPEIDVYMPVNYNTNGTTFSAAYFTSILTNYLSYSKQYIINSINVISIINNNKFFIDSKNNLFTLNIPKLFNMNKPKPKIKKRTRGNELINTFFGQITKESNSQMDGQVTVYEHGRPTTTTYPFSGRSHLKKDMYVYFLVGNFNSKTIAVCFEIVNSTFKIENLYLYAPDRGGHPEGHGTVTDTRPPDYPFTPTPLKYYVIDSRDEGIPDIYECESTRVYDTWDHVDYDYHDLTKPKTITKICGIWSDEN